MAHRIGVAIVLAIAMVASTLTPAQEWSIGAGGAARVEYNDNYFFSATDTQSGLTASLTPFVTAARRTENSDITALLAVGANKVWSVSPSVEYLSGNAGVNGSFRSERSTWKGSVSFVRSASLQAVSGQTATVLGLAYTNAANIDGAYTYALTERWSLGTTLGGYSNTYSAVAGQSGTTANNQGYYVGGNAGYAFSERTQLTATVAYTYYTSDPSRNNAVTTTIGVAHQFSPQLTASATVGGFWGNIDNAQTDTTSSQRRSDNGQLYGGGINYTLTERTRLSALVSEGLAPSSSGTLTKSDLAGVSLTHAFSERLTGRLGASYSRQTFPAAVSGTFSNSYYSGEAGMSYQLAERWKLDAGYRYSRGQYAQTPGEPRSNVVFLSIAYNWPGASFTDWVGQSVSSALGLPGAGALALSERSAGTSPLPSGSKSDESGNYVSPFDRFTIP